MTKFKSFFDVKGNEHLPDDDTPVTWRVSGYVVLLHSGRVLLVKQSWSDEYEIPGGGIEIHENVQQGAIREFEEETGIKINGCSDTPFFMHESNFYYSKGDIESYHHSLCLFFTSSLDSKVDLKSVTPSDENTIDRMWVALDQIHDASIQAMHKQALRKFVESIK